MKNLKLICSFLLITGLFFSCTEDELTGDSKLSPSSPTVSISVTGTSLTEQDTEIPFTVTLSEKQIVDVEVYIAQTGGDATLGVDFNVPSKIVIPANRTSVTGAITILPDEEVEATETFTLTFGDNLTANTAVTPVSATFELLNATDDMFITSLSWSTEPVFDASGSELDATDVADMIYQLIDSNGEVYIYPDPTYPDSVELYTTFESDGSGFEELVLDQIKVLDGVYELRASFFGVVDAGDLGGGYDVDLLLDYGQAGIQFGSLAYPAAMNIATNCVIADYVTMAKVTKAGANFTIENVNTTFASADFPDLIIPGSYTEINDDGNPVTATVTMSTPDANGNFTITNFAYSDASWCGHSDATLDLVVDGLDVYFPGKEGEGETQLVGNLPNICGIYGEVTVTLDDLGSWNPCTGIIKFGMTTRVAAGSFGHSDMTYTPN
jgi:hypothetical protein